MSELPFTFSPGNLIAPGVYWLNVNLHPVFAAISAAVEASLNFLEAILMALPAGGVIVIVAVLARMLSNWRMAVLAACSLGFCWLMGLWAASMQTIALMVLAVTLSVVIAFPLGVMASRRKTVWSLLRPLLDMMQAVPPWVYLIPVVIIFGLGRTPALIATVIYGLPPMLRLTTLGLNHVPKPLLELGAALGATRSTILWKIELPAAKPTILVGLNQCIMLSLAIVVLAGLVGSGGLGGEVTRGLARMEIGIGLRAGLSIVAIAVLLDRLSRAALDREPRRTA